MENKRLKSELERKIFSQKIIWMLNKYERAIRKERRKSINQERKENRVSSKEQNEAGNIPDQFKSFKCSNYQNYLKVFIKSKKKWKKKIY
jgi:hypothetical protein